MDSKNSLKLAMPMQMNKYSPEDQLRFLNYFCICKVNDHLSILEKALFDLTETVSYNKQLKLSCFPDYPE